LFSGGLFDLTYYFLPIFRTVELHVFFALGFENMAEIMFRKLCLNFFKPRILKNAVENSNFICIANLPGFKNYRRKTIAAFSTLSLFYTVDSVFTIVGSFVQNLTP